MSTSGDPSGLYFWPNLENRFKDEEYIRKNYARAVSRQTFGHTRASTEHYNEQRLEFEHA